MHMGEHQIMCCAALVKFSNSKAAVSKGPNLKRYNSVSISLMEEWGQKRKKFINCQVFSSM